MNKKIEKAVLASLRQAVAIHDGTASPAKGYTIAYTARRLPAIPAPRFTAARIVALRHSMKCSQPAFASLLNVSAPTVRAWEQSQRHPHGAAARLLQVIAAKPNVIRTFVSAPRSRVRTAAAR
jgi:putative transcriptional regulator